MNLERFAVLIDSYGAEPRRWPAAERDAALAFAAVSTAADALMREAAALDALLDTDHAAAATPAARRAVIAALPSTPVTAGQRWRELLALLGGWRIAVPAMAMALVAGINIGASAGASILVSSEAASTYAASEEDSRDPRYTPGFAESLILGLQQTPQ